MGWSELEHPREQSSGRFTVKPDVGSDDDLLIAPTREDLDRVDGRAYVPSETELGFLDDEFRWFADHTDGVALVGVRHGNGLVFTGPKGGVWMRIRRETPRPRSWNPGAFGATMRDPRAFRVETRLIPVDRLEDARQGTVDFTLLDRKADMMSPVFQYDAAIPEPDVAVEDDTDLDAQCELVRRYVTTGRWDRDGRWGWYDEEAERDQPDSAS